MSLLILGLNHASAPLALREQAAFAPESLPDALRQAQAVEGLSETVILSTCNRTELVTAGDHDVSELTRWLAGQTGLDAHILTEHAYCLEGAQAVRHIFRVAAGLDSMVIGEPQILGQVKAAVADAQAAGTLGPMLGRLFQKANAAAKHARSETAIGENPVSFAYAGVRLAEQIFEDITAQRALLIGAGEMIDLFAAHLRQRGVRRLVFTNRTTARAEELAHRHAGATVPYTQLDDYLPDADILVSCTAAPAPLITANALRRALKARRRQPICALDLAVPRDIEPAAGKLDDVYLYAVDDLQAIIERNQQARRNAAEQAEALIDAHVTEFAHWLDTRDAGALIGRVRERLDLAGEPLINKALARLQRGDDAEDVLRSLVHGMSGKWMHTPAVAIRQAEPTDQAALQDAVRRIFDLDNPS